jgi:hypothetical protein
VRTIQVPPASAPAGGIPLSVSTSEVLIGSGRAEGG